MAKRLHPQVQTDCLLALQCMVGTAWCATMPCRFVQLEARLAEVEQGLDSFRLSLADQERNTSERCWTMQTAY